VSTLSAEAHRQGRVYVLNGRTGKVVTSDNKLDLVFKVERYYTSTDFSAGIIETGIQVGF